MRPMWDTVSWTRTHHPRKQELAQFVDPDPIRAAKLEGAQGLPEFAGIQIQSEQGKPLMAIPQGLEKLRIPTAPRNVPLQLEGRERWEKLLQPPEQRRPECLADRTGKAEEESWCERRAAGWTLGRILGKSLAFESAPIEALELQMSVIWD